MFFFLRGGERRKMETESKFWQEASFFPLFQGGLHRLTVGRARGILAPSFFSLSFSFHFLWESSSLCNNERPPLPLSPMLPSVGPPRFPSPWDVVNVFVTGIRNARGPQCRHANYIHSYSELAKLTHFQ